MRYRALFAFDSEVALIAACDVFSGLAPDVPTAEWPELAPVATLPDFSGTWSQGPVGFGQPLTVGSVELQANELLRPADTLVIHADSYPSIEPSEQFAMVDVSVTCHAAAGETCNVTELNFSLQGDQLERVVRRVDRSLPARPGQAMSSSSSTGTPVRSTLRFSSFPGAPSPQGLFTLEPQGPRAAPSAHCDSIHKLREALT